jgi:hypothetical protein
MFTDGNCETVSRITVKLLDIAVQPDVGDVILTENVVGVAAGKPVIDMHWVTSELTVTAGSDADHAYVKFADGSLNPLGKAQSVKLDAQAGTCDGP